MAFHSSCLEKALNRFRLALPIQSLDLWPTLTDYCVLTTRTMQRSCSRIEITRVESVCRQPSPKSQVAKMRSSVLLWVFRTTSLTRWLRGAWPLKSWTSLQIPYKTRSGWKIVGLESEYNLRSPASKANDKSKDTINGYGRRCLLLYKAMVNMLGKAPANRAIAKHSGLAKLLSGKAHTLLGNAFPSANKVTK